LFDDPAVFDILFTEFKELHGAKLTVSTKDLNGVYEKMMFLKCGDVKWNYQKIVRHLAIETE
jgi:hypothetical protein